MLGYIYVILCIISWGLWGFFAKIATKYNDSLAVAIVGYIFYIFNFLLIFILFKSQKITINWNTKAIIWIGVTAIISSVGMLFYYMALGKLPASLVISLSALYPAVTVILSVFILKESFNNLQIIGLILILTGTILILIEN